ncbi:MAG TPA: inositol monophosphatase [Gammaproteobacteria bacterium]|jgi:myo-inositol-1(or 4)-monophosphatase|nr:inositol monophosphatase [Gammaproteobacteria bacterium]HBF63112.1 inositol monophosphatase [Gammaproteobacteria bacterium]HBK11500.1 inositol monophosphatase [Gammaproteobacteria bacterium]
MQPMANIALRAARKAGDFMLRAMDRPEEFDIETKAPNDFVSNIDKTAEAIIVDQIRETYPDHAIIGEEFGAKSGNSEFTWIIDPLDGTLNFLQGIPHFAISIGIMKGRHHEHGIIYDPVRGEEFIASRGSGAQLNGKRIRVSARSKLEDCVLATGLPPGSVENRLDEYMVGLKDLTGSCRGIRRAGSAALDLAYVAAGRTDGFWEMGLSQWDIAAGIVLVREAGGFVSDLEGGESFFNSGDIIAANPKCWRTMVQVLNR